jgi:hypothetical protein
VGRDQDSQFEWVNAWAETARPAPVAPTAPKTEPAPPVMARVAPIPDDHLMRDIAEIERVRDRLAVQPVAVSFGKRTQALTLVPSRTTDPVPVVIGGVLALVMLTVFGAAAAMTKLAR